MLLNTDIDNTVRAMMTTATWILGVGIAVLLAIALLGEILRAVGRAPGLVRAVERSTPLGLRRVAAALVAVVVTMAGSIAPVLAAEPAATTSTISVRAWLNGEPDPQPGSEVGGEHTVPGLPVAGPSGRPSSDAPDDAGSRSKSGLTYAPRTGAAPGTGSTAPANAPSATSYVVKPGDSLWRIASRLLGSNATNPQIDAAWRRIYKANATAIGSNPSLIHPGLELTLPPPD